MHKDCRPDIVAFARCMKFICEGGPDAPHQHDRIFVELPRDFQRRTDDKDLSKLHDQLLELFPAGGSFRWHQVREFLAPEKLTVPPVTLEGELAEKVKRYTDAGGNPAGLVQALLKAAFETIDGPAYYRFEDCWKHVAGILGTPAK